MILTTKGRYAVTAALDIAKNSLKGPVSLMQISKRNNIPLKYLEQIALNLKNKEILFSIKGPKGGYKLTMHCSNLTIEQILDAAEEHIKLTKCSGNKNCMPDNTECNTHHLWAELEIQVRSFLKNLTLDDVMNNKYHTNNLGVS